MLVYLSIMVGAYIFTRMFTAGIRNYPNNDKFTNTAIRILSILTALFIVGCLVLIIMQGAGVGLDKYILK